MSDHTPHPAYSYVYFFCFQVYIWVYEPPNRYRYVIGAVLRKCYDIGIHLLYMLVILNEDAHTCSCMINFSHYFLVAKQKKQKQCSIDNQCFLFHTNVFKYTITCLYGIPFSFICIAKCQTRVFFVLCRVSFQAKKAWLKLHYWGGICYLLSIFLHIHTCMPKSCFFWDCMLCECLNQQIIWDHCPRLQYHSVSVNHYVHASAVFRA